MSAYDLVVTEVAPGWSPERTARALARVFAQPPTQMLRLLQARPVVVRRALTLAQAQTLQQTLHRAGCQVVLRTDATASLARWRTTVQLPALGATSAMRAMLAAAVVGGVLSLGQHWRHEQLPTTPVQAGTGVPASPWPQPASPLASASPELTLPVPLVVEVIASRPRPPASTKPSAPAAPAWPAHWQGVYLCAASGQANFGESGAFRTQVQLHVATGHASLRRRHGEHEEVLEGQPVANTTLLLSGQGRSAEGTVWRTSFLLHRDGDVLAGNGVMETIPDAAKLRDCSLRLRALPAPA